MKSFNSCSLCVIATALLVAGGGAWGASPNTSPAAGSTVNGSTAPPTEVAHPKFLESPFDWDIYVDGFYAQVWIFGLSYDDGDCVMSGGAVNSTFTLSPISRGKKLATISADPSIRSFAIEFLVDSDATVSAQSGQEAPGVPLVCSATSDHYVQDTYRLAGTFEKSTAFAKMTSSMPGNAATRNATGCPPQGSTCHVQFWFDNSPGTARTMLDMDTLFIDSSVTLPITGVATNVAGYREKRSGTFEWSGEVRLRAVQAPR